jgi:branched-chain amino acid transport system substrate-binding protein
VAITRQMKELNVNAKMYGPTVGRDLPEYYDLLKQNAECVYGATQWDDRLPYPGAKEFAASDHKEFGREPSYHAASRYAGCMVYAEAVKRAGTIDADRVRAALLMLETKTMFGDFKVDETGFQTAHKMVMLQWQDGKKMTVWPDGLAVAKPRFPMPPWTQG